VGFHSVALVLVFAVGLFCCRFIDAVRSCSCSVSLFRAGLDLDDEPNIAPDSMEVEFSLQGNFSSLLEQANPIGFSLRFRVFAGGR
jgi:hypothetical protein